MCDDSSIDDMPAILSQQLRDERLHNHNDNPAPSWPQNSQAETCDE